MWMYAFCALGSLQENVDLLDASEVMYLELNARQEMKRKWSGRRGDKFTASSIRHLNICQIQHSYRQREKVA